MKITKTISNFKNKIFLLGFLTLTPICLFLNQTAYSQIDHYYGSGSKGFKFGIELGGSNLQTHWSSNPIGLSSGIDIDYAIGSYFSIGLQEQYAYLQGVDADNKLYYPSTKFSAFNTNLNLKFGVGLFSKTGSDNNFTDILKSTYLSIGVGSIFSTGTLGKPTFANSTPLYVYNPNTKQLSTGSYSFTNNCLVVPIGFGTNINLFGSDKTVLSPQYQYNYAIGTNGKFLDGYLPNASQGSGGYSTFGVSLKFKL